MSLLISIWRFYVHLLLFSKIDYGCEFCFASIQLEYRGKYGRIRAWRRELSKTLK